MSASSGTNVPPGAGSCARTAHRAPRVLRAQGADPGAAAPASPGGRSRGRWGEQVIAKPAANTGAGLRDRFVAIRDLGLMVLPPVSPGVIAGLTVGDTTGQVAGVGDLAGVTAATGAGAGLADASRITSR